MGYETTEVSVSKSQEQIRKLIYSHKGTGLMLVSQPPQEGFEAMIEIEKTVYRIRVMAKCKDVSEDKRGFTRTATAHAHAIEQENRRVWRVLYWHLKAMFEASDSGVIDIRDVVMPYVVLSDGSTFSQHVAPNMPLLLNLKPERLLGGGL
jgi:hypothetical protein